MKVVLDTNVLIDGLRDEHSYQKRIIDAVIAGNLEAYANRQTLQENKLLIKQLIDNPEYEELLEQFFQRVNQVINRHQVQVVEDREDNKILESAVEAQADFLITNDRDLLSLKEYKDVAIVSPAGFWTEHHDSANSLWKQWAGFIAGQKKWRPARVTDRQKACPKQPATTGQGACRTVPPGLGGWGYRGHCSEACAA